MKGPLIDIAATLFLLAIVLLGGYLWLKSESNKVNTSKKELTTVIQPLVFEVEVKRTE